MRIHPLTFVAIAAFAGLTESAAQAQTAGEHFTPRQVVDHQQGDMVAETFQAPAAWTDHSEVRWNYRNDSLPATVMAAVENPSTQEALYVYPSEEFVMLPGVSRQGPTRDGRVWASPMPVGQAMSAYVQQARGSLPGFRIVSSRQASELPVLRQMDASLHPQGITMRVTYELQGKAMEEDFSAAYHLANVCSNTPLGRACQTNWGLYAPQSVRAPAGTLDRRLPVFAAIQSSFRQNPAWAQRANAVRGQIVAQEARSIQEHGERSRDAGRRAQDIVARADARREANGRAFTDHIRAGDPSSAGASGGRSIQDRFDDYDRGVTTLQEANGDTTQRSSSQQYHWTDGNGSYRDSNDSSYDPNKTENGSWTLMNEAR